MANKACQIAFDDEAADEDFYGDIVSLTVEESTTTAGTFHLQLRSVHQDDGSWTYLDDDQLALFTKVSIQIGFMSGGGLSAALGGLTNGNDGLEPVFDGYITAVNVNLGSQPGNAFIDVMGTDTSVLMSLEEKIVTWPNLSDSDIVQQIVSDYGVQVEADDTATVHDENDTTVIQRGTDIQFVCELARRNSLEFYFETDKDSGDVVAFLRKPQLDGTPQPDLAIQFGDDSNLRSFSTRLSGQRPLNVKTEQMDVKENSPNIGQASDTQFDKLGDKDVNALVGDQLDRLVTPREAQAQMLVLGTPTSDATELQTLAQAVRDEAAWFIDAQGEINSDAYQAVLRPRRLVLIKGAGKQYSGKYYVTSVAHQLRGDGSYTQKFEARRNARDLDGTEEFGGGDLGLPLTEV